MAGAQVGDDCYGDDPTVLALEARVCALLGKQAAVFLPTGTMANQIALRVHCRPGQTVACHPTAHVRIHEDASAAALNGVQLMPIGGRRGYRVEELEALIHEESCGWPKVALCWFENTLGDAGGDIWPLRTGDEQRSSQQLVRTYAETLGRPIHLDGARLWNAHIATREPLAQLAAVGDTVSVALSKGLGAPGGSLLCGTQALIDTARGFKHAMGGGMRQAGVLAAAGLYALGHNLEALQSDHQRAKRLAAAIADLACWSVEQPQTNMVIASVRAPVRHAEQLCEPLRAAGVLCYPNRYQEVRLAVHRGLNDDALDTVIERILKVVPAAAGM